MKIGTDLDGVLAHTGEEINNRIEKQFKIPTQDIHLIGYSKFFEDNGLDVNWLKKLWDDEWLWARSVPDPENIATVVEWQKAGHEVHIVTAREQKTTAMVTRKWLQKNGIDITNLYFAPMMHKVDYLKAKEIPVMFEDMFFEANKIASHGIPCFVVNMPYNQEFKDRVTNPLVTFIDRLADANSFIQEREVVG